MLVASYIGNRCVRGRNIVALFRVQGEGSLQGIIIEKGVKEAIGTLIVQFGSFGKAPLVEQASLDEMAERYKKM